MRVTIRKSAHSGENQLRFPPEGISRSYEQLYRQFILNYSDYQPESLTALDSLPNMLIITHDNFVFSVHNLIYFT